jgi:hypothetical protein
MMVFQPVAFESIGGASPVFAQDKIGYFVVDVFS